MEDQDQPTDEVDTRSYTSSSLPSGNVNAGDDHQLGVYGDAGFKYPPGYRFDPYDHELVVSYLKPKLLDLYVPPNVIQEVELYSCNPEELAASFKPHEGRRWYFFTPRERKYKNGDRPNRAAGEGYWKATGADKAVMHRNAKVGFRKALVFYKGKSPNGIKTDWIMHEYRLDDPPKRERAGNDDMTLDKWVLCRIYKKYDKSSRGRNSSRAREDSDDGIDEHEHEDTTTHAHVSAESNVLLEGTDIPPPPPPHSADINTGYCNPQPTGMPPFNPYDISTTARISDDMRSYSESPQSMLRDNNEFWAEQDNNGHFLPQMSNVLHKEAVIPSNYYGNCSRQVTRMQYLNTYDNVGSWQPIQGLKYSQNRQSLSTVHQSRFHPYNMQSSTPMHHMTHVHPNTKYQIPGFDDYAYQNLIYQNLFPAKAMPGSSTPASQSSENHVKAEPSSSQPERQSAESHNMKNEHFNVSDGYISAASSDESCLHEQYFNPGEY